jgi:hypothetical protein
VQNADERYLNKYLLIKKERNEKKNERSKETYCAYRLED